MHTIWKRAGAVTAALGIAGGAALATAAPGHANSYEGKVIFASGHADVLHVAESNGIATLEIHDGSTSPATHRAPEDVVFHVLPSVASRTANEYIAEGIPGFTTAGSTVYVLPQTSQSGAIFAGFGHSLPQGSAVEYSLTEVEGPGRFAAWQSSEEGPSVFLNPSTGLPASFTSTAAHEHLNWGFTDQGEYTLSFDVNVTKPDSTVLQSATHEYTFFVGETLPEDSDPSVTLEITGLSGHYHAGGVATLTAVQTPAEGLDHYHWLTRLPGEAEWSYVPDAYTASYGFIVRSADDGRELIARLYDHSHNQIAESAPVTIHVDDHGNSPLEGPTISATLAETAGALVVSVAPENREVVLSDFQLNSSADRYVATGELLPITVTDTRSGDAGWNVNGRVRSFTTVDGESLAGGHLGWAPKVLSASEGQAVTPGEAKASILSGGPGVGAYTELASSAAGEGKGTAQLGADLTLEAPTGLEPGTYTGLLILTVI
jgi:surface-anchored protein